MNTSSADDSRILVLFDFGSSATSCAHVSEIFMFLSRLEKKGTAKVKNVGVASDYSSNSCHRW